MDDDSCNKFMGSLTKYLQSLCHSYVSFEDGVELVGHIYLNVDTGKNGGEKKIDYVLHESVCKNGANVVKFTSNSYHAQPSEKKEKKDPPKKSSEPSKSDAEAQKKRDDDDVIIVGSEASKKRRLSSGSSPNVGSQQHGGRQATGVFRHPRGLNPRMAMPGPHAPRTSGFPYQPRQRLMNTQQPRNYLNAPVGYNPRMWPHHQPRGIQPPGGRILPPTSIPSVSGPVTASGRTDQAGVHPTHYPRQPVPHPVQQTPQMPQRHMAPPYPFSTHALRLPTSTSVPLSAKPPTCMEVPTSTTAVSHPRLTVAKGEPVSTASCFLSSQQLPSTQQSIAGSSGGTSLSKTVPSFLHQSSTSSSVSRSLTQPVTTHTIFDTDPVMSASSEMAVSRHEVRDMSSSIFSSNTLTPSNQPKPQSLDLSAGKSEHSLPKSCSDFKYPFSNSMTESSQPYFRVAGILQSPVGGDSNNILSAGSSTSSSYPLVSKSSLPNPSISERHMSSPGSGNNQPHSTGHGNNIFFAPGNESGNSFPSGSGGNQPFLPGNGSGHSFPPESGSSQSFPPGSRSNQPFSPGSGSSLSFPPVGGSSLSFPPASGSSLSFPPASGANQPFPPGSGANQPFPLGSGNDQSFHLGSGSSQPFLPENGNSRPISSGSGNSPSFSSSMKNDPNFPLGSQNNRPFPPSSGNNQSFSPGIGGTLPFCPTGSENGQSFLSGSGNNLPFPAGIGNNLPFPAVSSSSSSLPYPPASDNNLPFLPLRDDLRFQPAQDNNLPYLPVSSSDPSYPSHSGSSHLFPPFNESNVSFPAVSSSSLHFPSMMPAGSSSSPAVGSHLQSPVASNSFRQTENMLELFSQQLPEEQTHLKSSMADPSLSSQFSVGLGQSLPQDSVGSEGDGFSALFSQLRALNGPQDNHPNSSAQSIRSVPLDNVSHVETSSFSRVKYPANTEADKESEGDPRGSAIGNQSQENDNSSAQTFSSQRAVENQLHVNQEESSPQAHPSSRLKALDTASSEASETFLAPYERGGPQGTLDELRRRSGSASSHSHGTPSPSPGSVAGPENVTAESKPSAHTASDYDSGCDSASTSTGERLASPQGQQLSSSHPQLKSLTIPLVPIDSSLAAGRFIVKQERLNDKADSDVVKNAFPDTDWIKTESEWSQAMALSGLNHSDDSTESNSEEDDPSYMPGRPAGNQDKGKTGSKRLRNIKASKGKRGKKRKVVTDDSDDESERQQRQKHDESERQQRQKHDESERQQRQKHDESERQQRQKYATKNEDETHDTSPEQPE